MQKPPHVISLMVCMGDSSGLEGIGYMELLWIVIDISLMGPNEELQALAYGGCLDQLGAGSRIRKYM